MTGDGTKQERTEYGYRPTICHCSACIKQCEFISGFLVPGDLPRWRAHFGAERNVDLANILLASPGAVLMGTDRKIYRIGTIVPARIQTGACFFLNQEKRCTIYSVAPYGCRFFSEHMPANLSQEMSIVGHTEIFNDWNNGGPYSTLWLHLQDLGRIAEGPEVLRKRIAQTI